MTSRPRGRHLRRPRQTWLLSAVVVSSLLTGCDAFDCDRTADRSASVTSEGISSVLIISEAGSLEVDGELNLTEVRAEGTACASNDTDLGDIQFEVTTNGDEVVIEARTPDGNSRFDVNVTVPDTVAVEIQDGSGFVDLRDVAAVRVTDGSGDIDVTDVTGDVRVVDDGSGDISVRGTGGTVRIDTDGSGDIAVTDVDGDVLIGSDGSGSITVTGVEGDFEVGEGGSGSISYSEVGGTVDIPDG